MLILPATIEDAKMIHQLQRLAYRSEALIYDDFSIPPLAQTLDDLQEAFTSKFFLKAIENGEIVGSVRAHQDDEATCHIERLIVHPAFQAWGIGTALMQRVEVVFNIAIRFELFTGRKSQGNIRLYQRLGYRLFKQKAVTENLAFVFLEKNQ